MSSSEEEAKVKADMEDDEVQAVDFKVATKGKKKKKKKKPGDGQTGKFDTEVKKVQQEGKLTSIIRTPFFVFRAIRLEQGGRTRKLRLHLHAGPHREDHGGKDAGERRHLQRQERDPNDQVLLLNQDLLAKLRVDLHSDHP